MTELVDAIKILQWTLFGEFVLLCVVIGLASGIIADAIRNKK